MSGRTSFDRLVMSDEVRAALADGRPVVSLESSLIAQGLPPRQLAAIKRWLVDVATTMRN